MVNVKEKCPDVYRAFQWYLTHQDELVKQYDGKYLLISDSAVHGAYDSFGDAVFAGRKQCQRGKFAVQRCSPGDKDYTARIATPFLLK
jgi:hypothetical protein